MHGPLTLLFVLLLVACERVDARGSTGMTPRIAQSLAAFRDDLGNAMVSLDAGAAATRDELVDRYVHALETADTAAFGAMSITTAEFAWLYYPFTHYIRPPYELDPDVVWLLISENARKGMGRALREHGGRALGFTGYRCGSVPERIGPNLLWNGCLLDVTIDGRVVTLRLFASIIERDGRFKFMSYANDL